MFINRVRFYPKKTEINLKQFMKVLDTNIKSNRIINNININDISSLDNILDNSVLFINGNLNIIESSKKVVIITNNYDFYSNSNNPNIILVKDINLSYNLLIKNLFYHDDDVQFSDDFDYLHGSYISKYSDIHSDVKIGNNCVIGRGVKIDQGTIIKNNVVIKNSIISKNVIIGDNSTIGSSGFGFDLKNLGATNLLPQIGYVIIGENVRIGSNCTVDRAKIDFTYIGKNTMIDNLVHIAHNVIIGKNSCIAAQTGISGSTKIGDNLIAGGQSGFSGHLKIGNNVVVAAKSGVTKNINDNSIVAGFPATDIKEWKKMIIRLRKNGHK